MANRAYDTRAGWLVRARRLLILFCAVTAWSLGREHASAGELLDVPAQALPKHADDRLRAALAAHQGHPVVINFWGTWCQPCREEMPALQRLADRWRGRGLAVITVAMADTRKRADDYLWEISVELPVVDDLDSSIGRAWGARAVPTTLILDRRHRLRLRAVGALDWDAPGIDGKIQALFN